MLVRQRMSPRVIVCEPSTPLAAATKLLRRHGIRQLPVMENGKLAGIVTDRDLRGAPAGAAAVGEVMTRRPLTTGPDAAIDEAAQTLRARKINALPVVDGGQVIGMLTTSDVLDAFVELSGVAEPSYRLTLSAPKGKDAERQVREIVASHRGELCWIRAEGRRPSPIALRVKVRDVDEIATALEAAGFEVDSVVASTAAPAAE
jgi:acetoin utilization protein AcuB